MRVSFASREEGFALPLALWIMMIVSLFLVATVGFATHNTDRSVHDHRAARAIAAADAGIDAAVYRMNKAIMAAQVPGVLGVPAAVVAETKCIDVSAGNVTLLNPINGWCQAMAGTEEVDGGATGQGWLPAAFSYTVRTGVNIGTAPDNPNAELIQRKIVAVGTVGDVTKRVLATVHLRLAANDNLLGLFEQVGYKTCNSAIPTGNPDSGC